jgi:hypothetical protein
MNIIIDYLKLLIKYIQFTILLLSYSFFRCFRRFLKKVNWVIGVDEMAKMIFSLKNLFSDSYSVSLSKNPYYSSDYNLYNKLNNRILSTAYRFFCGPIALGFLLNKANKFIYIWKTGFLVDRDIEFKFLKSRGKKIVCIFVGDDIRSLELRKKLYTKLNIDGSANYLNRNDKDPKAVASVADQYADVIFSASVDQVSYLKSKQYYPFFYYCMDNFNRNDAKFNNKIKITHAASDPIIKGTQIVRAALKKLELEGYIFEYVQLENTDNNTVLHHLKSSHIVLSEFYAFALGVFSIESMANHCAVLTSSNPQIETGLPQNDKNAWLITQAWEVYDNLKYLLDNPEKIKYFADKGYEYAFKHHTFESVNKYVNKILKDNDIEH